MIAVHNAVIDRGTKPNIVLPLVGFCWVSFPGYSTITCMLRNGTKPNLRIYTSTHRIWTLILAALHLELVRARPNLELGNERQGEISMRPVA
jgi:hypothetical protein